jgi:hypothetical protein
MVQSDPSSLRSLTMSSILIVTLLYDYEVKDVKVHTFKLKHEDNEEKETFDVKKPDGMTIEMLFNTVLSFQTMSTRMAFSGPLMNPYFGKWLPDNALEEWCSVTPHQDDQSIQNFEYSQEEWLTSLLPNNASDSQKELVAIVMCKPYSMKVKDFGNCIKEFIWFLALMSLDNQDYVFTDTDLKSLLLKFMPLSWQIAYTVKVRHISNNFFQMPSYFVQSQSIGDSQVSYNPFLSTATMHNGGRQFSHGHTGHGPHDHSLVTSSSGNQNFSIPYKTNIGTHVVYLACNGPCPVHPILTHAWGNCFNNPNNTFTGSQNVKN